MPQLGLDCFDPCNMCLGPLTVLRVRFSDPRPSFRRRRPSAQAAVQPATFSVFQRGVLAEAAFSVLGQATFARPIRSETGLNPNCVNSEVLTVFNISNWMSLGKEVEIPLGYTISLSRPSGSKNI